MQNILELKEGLPPEKRNVTPFLIQLNFDGSEYGCTGTTLFEDGELYILTKPNLNLYKWQCLTSVKEIGLLEIKKELQKGFYTLDRDLSPQSSGRGYQLWKSFLGGKEWEVKAPNGSYNTLPPVFKIVDDLINTHLYTKTGKMKNQG